VKITLFSVEEANRLVQSLRPQLERLVAAKGEFDRLGRRIDVIALALSGASADNPDAQVRRELLVRRTRVADEIRLGLQTLQHHGCIVKDLERGLLDFYSLAGDRLIFLCWHLGEPEVGHWHPLEGGFATRQPLDRTERE